MQPIGVIGVVLTFAAVLTACGDDKKAGEPSEAGSGGSSGKGATHPGGEAGDGVGGTQPTGGRPGGGGGGTGAEGGRNDAGQAGELNVGGNYDPEDPNPIDPQPITLTVLAGEGQKRISPLIYGANMDGLSCSDSRARFSFCRHRSAAWSTYNWETNASNAGAINCNENNAALSESDEPAAAITDLIDQAADVSASTIVTLAMLEYVAADRAGGGPNCAGDVSNTADYLDSRFKQNRLRKGSALSLVPDAMDAYVNQDELLHFLADYTASTPANLLFSLDNQPELWHLEHPRVHPAAPTYDEVVGSGVEYAKLVKDTLPDAEVVGLVGYGYLAAHSLQQSADYATKGEFFDYYLQQMAAAEEADGRRLIDYVDLHWFSEIYADDQRVIFEGTTFQSVLDRVQGPRSFWDPSYIEKSWITQATEQPIQLFDWLQDSIAENYPGTKLALSEWSFGGGTHISGAVAAADSLGLFGQKGVELAGVVSFSPDEEPYLIGAFQAFRNYDGQGASFGDTSVSATSSNPHHGTIYASVDEADPSRLVMVAINRRAGDLITTLNIEHSSSYTTLTPYKIHDGQPEPTRDDVIEAQAPNEFELTIPGYSIWVLVAGD